MVMGGVIRREFPSEVPVCQSLLIPLCFPSVEVVGGEKKEEVERITVTVGRVNSPANYTIKPPTTAAANSPPSI